MLEFKLLFKLLFLPFHAYLMNDTIKLLGERIVSIYDGKPIEDRKLGARYRGSCIISGRLIVFTDEGLQLSNLHKRTRFDEFACLGDRIVLKVADTLRILDASLNQVASRLVEDGFFFGGFIFRKASGKYILESPNDSTTYELPILGKFYPNYVFVEDSFFVITGNTRRMFYMLFFKEDYLYWYFRMTRRTLPYGISYIPELSAILTYGTSRRTFFAELRSIEGEAYWSYQPHAIGIALIDEAFRGFVRNGDVFYFYGYSEREGDRRAVVKAMDIEGNLLWEWISGKEYRDVLFMFSVKGRTYAVVLGKEILGFYEVKFKQG